jgi:predicted DNA-binding transcriptional regulator AlpA
MVDLGDDALLTRAEVSKLTGRSSRALEYDAAVGQGIPYVRIGERNVRYRVGDVRAYIRSRTFPHRAAELARQTGA